MGKRRKEEDISVRTTGFVLPRASGGSKRSPSAKPGRRGSIREEFAETGESRKVFLSEMEKSSWTLDKLRAKRKWLKTEVVESDM